MTLVLLRADVIVRHWASERKENHEDIKQRGHLLDLEHMCEYSKQLLTKFGVDAEVDLRLNLKINWVCNVDPKSCKKNKIKVSTAWTSIFKIWNENTNSSIYLISIFGSHPESHLIVGNLGKGLFWNLIHCYYKINVIIAITTTNKNAKIKYK